MDSKTARWVKEMRTAWELETARRKKAAKLPQTRLLLKTTRGDVEIVLFRFAEQGYDKKLVQWLTDAKLADTAPQWVTGALGAAWAGLPSEVLPPKDKNPRVAWRGTVVLGDNQTLVLATGPLYITQRGAAIGRIVKGMQHVDAMTASDRIVAAQVVPAAARDGGG